MDILGQRKTIEKTKFQKFVAMTHELAIIIGLVFLVVCVTASDYAGLSFNLTRFANDRFENPTATNCKREPENEKFCTDTNSRCGRNCCQCTCDNPKSTFDRSTMTCRINKEFRFGCKINFKGSDQETGIKRLDLTKDGKAKINWQVDTWNDEVNSFEIISINSYHDGSGMKNKFLKEKLKGKGPEKEKPKTKNGKCEASIQWDKVEKNSAYNGKVFRVNISYEIKKASDERLVNKNDCFIFKSKGNIMVTFPTLPSTTPSPITMSRTPSSKTKLPSSNTPNEISTPAISMTTQESKKTRKPTESTGKTDDPPVLTPGARKEGGVGGNDATTVSLAVVGCLLLLVAVVLVVLWTRRRSAKASKEKTRGAADADGSVDNPLENIYAEADTSINYPQKGKNNHVYDYAKGNLESNYTSLDMSKVESKPTYESLVNVQSNMYEQIPVNCNTPGASGVSGQTPIAEPFYHVVDTLEGAQDPGQICHDPDNCETRREIPGRTGDDNPERVYSTLEDEGAPENFGREVPGRTGDDNPERVYSTLEEEEEESAPENYGREVPGRTGDDDTERVYSVLEDEAAESDYLTILPEKSDYEQPINPPMSHA